MKALDTNFNDNSDQLFRLVKSFSKAEKRGFKMLYGRGETDKKFVKLFDSIDRLTNYDEEKLKRNKDFTAGQLPNLKIQLYNKLLDSLRFYNAQSSAKLQVNSLIDNACILYDRCMYSDCLKQLEKAKVLAKKHDLVTPLVEINELQQQTFRLTLTDKRTEMLDDLLLEMTIVIKRLNQINGFVNLSLKLNSLYARIGSTRNKEELKKVKDFFNRKISSFSQKQSGIEEQLYYYSAVTGFYFFIRDFKEAEKTSKKWVDYIEKNELLKYQRTEFYIRALNSLLVAQNKLYAMDEFTVTHKKLITIKRDVKFVLSRNLNLLLFKAIYIHEMNRHFMLGDFKSGTRIVARHQAEINRFLPLLDQNTRFLFYYKIACLYFGSNQFKQSLVWLNKIITRVATNVREDLQSFARILRLICYVELNDDFAVQANIKSTYRFLLSRKNYGQYENLIIQFLKKLKGNETQRELQRRFSDLQQDMIRISKLKFEKRAFIYFDMIAWLESKVQNKEIQEVFKQRINKGIRYVF